MGIELIGRTIIFDDTQANVEANAGVLTELCFGRNSSTGALGYTIDKGITWVWLPISMGGGDVFGTVTLLIVHSLMNVSEREIAISQSTLGILEF